MRCFGRSCPLVHSAECSQQKWVLEMELSNMKISRGFLFLNSLLHHREGVTGCILENISLVKSWLIWFAIYWWLIGWTQVKVSVTFLWEEVLKTLMMSPGRRPPSMVVRAVILTEWSGSLMLCWNVGMEEERNDWTRLVEGSFSTVPLLVGRTTAASWYSRVTCCGRSCCRWCLTPLWFFFAPWIDGDVILLMERSALASDFPASGSSLSSALRPWTLPVWRSANAKLDDVLQQSVL